MQGYGGACQTPNVFQNTCLAAGILRAAGYSQSKAASYLQKH
ncbi:hypothetical protein ACP70R_015007 [Stipagrostis hirtigluma subsp. patula]